MNKHIVEMDDEDMLVLRRALHKRIDELDNAEILVTILAIATLNADGMEKLEADFFAKRKEASND